MQPLFELWYIKMAFVFITIVAWLCLYDYIISRWLSEAETSTWLMAAMLTTPESRTCFVQFSSMLTTLTFSSCRSVKELGQKNWFLLDSVWWPTVGSSIGHKCQSNIFHNKFCLTISGQDYQSAKHETAWGKWILWKFYFCLCVTVKYKQVEFNQPQSM